jgi:hypothetical protein
MECSGQLGKSLNCIIGCQPYFPEPDLTPHLRVAATDNDRSQLIVGPLAVELYNSVVYFTVGGIA